MYHRYYPRSSSRWNKPARMIVSDRDTVCAETGKAIAKGDECLYFPSSRRVYHPDSKEAYDWRNRRADEDLLGTTI